LGVTVEEDHGYIRNVQFIGVEDGAPYFDVQVEGLDGGVVISTAVASRYGLGVGDTLSVFDPLTSEEHTFEIKGTTDYSVQLSVFMDIGDLRSLLGKEGIAYNTAYSDAPLGFEKAQLDGSATKEQLIAPVEQLGPEVQGSRDSFYALAILFYAVMMVYLIQFAVVRRRRDAASLAAIGYGNGELIWFLAGKLLIVACASALVCLLVGYEISVLLMPTLVASTPIGLMIDYPLPEYLLHLACALAIIALAAFLGLRRIAHTDNLYYLRNRE
jgi:putative ABC transport system permease protein